MAAFWHSRALLVQGFNTSDLDSSISQLISYFENETKSGGGPLQQTAYSPGVTITEITQRVLQRKEHIVKIHQADYTLNVKRCLQEFVSKYFPQMEEGASESTPGACSLQSATVLQPSKVGECTNSIEKPASKPLELSLTEHDDFKLSQSGIDSTSGPSSSFFATDSQSHSPMESESKMNTRNTTLGARPKTYTKPHPVIQKEAIQVPNKKVVVSGATETLSADILELYFEHSKSGGGPVRSIDICKNGVIIEFEHESAAAEVVRRLIHTISGIKCFTKFYVEPKPTAADISSRVVVITGVKMPISQEILELWLESPKNGGGPITRLDEDPHTHIFTVEFENPQNAAHLLKMQSATVSKVKITFSKPVDFNQDDVDSEPTSIVVTGFDPSVGQEILQLYFENENKSGGGPLDFIEFDETKNQAIIKFQNEKVAHRVLKKSDLKLQNKRLRVSMLKKYKWDGRTIEVHGIYPELNIEMLSLIFESRKKSGGGQIEEVQIGKQDAFIRFVNKHDARRVLDQKTVVIDGKTLTIHKPSGDQDVLQHDVTEEQEPEPTSEIMVLGVGQGTTVDVLEIFFENKDKSGGGPVKNVQLDKEWGTAVITFEDHTVAERVAKRKTLKCMGKEVHVELKTPLQASIRGSSLQNMYTPRDDSKFKLEVTGIPENTKKDHINLYFESTKYSGGGPIEDMDFDSETGTAIISFKENETLKSVMKKQKETGLSIQDIRLKVQMIEASRCSPAIKGSCAIEVRGTPANVTDDMIKYFFENRRKSGGGEIEEYVFLEDSIVITFAKNDVAESVFMKHNSTPLKMEDMPIDVKHLRNRHRPKFLPDHSIIQPNTLFLEDLPENAQNDDIINFLQKLTKCEVRDIWFGVQKGKAIAHFYMMPDYQEFYQLCCLKPLMGKMIGVQCIEKPKSIEVYNIKQLSKQRLEMYFEHKRSGGGDIERMQMHTDEDYVIITFLKYGYAESVVSRKDHKMDEISLTVGLHYECLGILPPGHDRSTPRGSLPNDLHLQDIDLDIVHYLSQTPSNRVMVENALSEVGAMIEWPHGAANEIDSGVTVKCTLKPSSATKDKIDAWPDKTKAKLQESICLFIKDSVNVLQEGWDQFCSSGALADQIDDSMMIKMDRESCTVTVIGKQAVVDTFVQGLQQRKYDIENIITRKKEAINEDLKNLPQYKVRFVQAVRLPQEMRAAFPNAQIQCFVKDKKISIRGLPGEVQTIKLRLLELMNEIVSDSINMTPKATDLLKHKKTRDYVIKQFQNQQIFMMFDVEKKGRVSCFTRKIEDLNNGIAVLKASIIEHTQDVSSVNEGSVHTPEWKSFIANLLSDYDGELLVEVAEDASQYTIVCVDAISAGVLEQIKAFLDENTILEQFINMDEGTLKLLKLHKSTELKEIERKFSAAIAYCELGKYGLNVKGTKQILALSIPQVVQLASDIVMCTHGINKPGMPKFFISPKGKDYLESLELKNKVAITIGDKTQDSVSVADLMSSVSPIVLKQPKVKSKVELDSGHIIYVAEGDLTEYKVDVIVNAANEDLAHVGGIAKAIVDKGGPSIQEECNRFIKSRGRRLRPGEIFASDAGKLPCKKITHAIGPRWQGGFRNEENDLYQAVYKSLESVQRMGQKTIGIPAISSGVFGFPMSVACKTIIEASRDFCLADQQLTEIHLVDPNMKVVNTFHEELCKMFRDNEVSLVTEKRGPRAMPGKQIQKDDDASATFVPAYWKKGSAPSSLNSAEGISVQCIQGEIARQRADVIVNTTSKDLNLDVGAVSLSISKAAGPALQQECKQAAPTGIPKGGIVQTGGANIGCKKIYHGSLPHWDNSKGDKILREFMALCLNTAHGSGMSSIAIPAIGTGNLSYPRDKVAATMFDEVKKFSKKNGGTTLRDIRFLVYDQPTVACFHAEISKLEQNLQPKTGKVKGRKLRSDPVTARGPEISHSDSSFSPGAYGSMASSGYATSAGAASAVLVINANVTIQVIQGDITEEKADAIVNGTNKALVMGSQVSRAIIKKAGPEVEAQCTRIGKTKGHIATTTAGNLKSKHIIHVAVPDELDGWIIKHWSKRVHAVMKEAVKLGCSSLSFPALGTGTLSLSADEMAKTMINSIIDFCNTKGDQTQLELVRIVIYQQAMVSTFQRQLEHYGNQKKGMLQKVSDYVFGEPTRERDMFFKRSNKDIHIPLHTSKLTFQIYGSDQGSVDEVTKRIEMTCEDESKEYVLDSKSDQEAIKCLTEDQIAAIKKFEITHSVRIQIQKVGRINKIIVEGRMEDNITVVTEIHKILREIEDETKRAQHAEHLHKLVQWEVDEGSGFEPYPPSISAFIEKAFHEKRPHVEFNEETEDNELRTCNIIFGENVEIINGDVTNKYPVKRNTPESIPLPREWSDMKGQTFLVVNLVQGQKEYATVENKFKNSMQAGGSSFNSVVSVSRIQNPSLYQRYSVHKKHMEKCNPPSTQNERELWHGTSGDALDEIHAAGFNRGFCGRNGTAHGKGVYFATFASLSSGYATPDVNGHKHMYLSRVLTGEFTRSNPAYIVPPPKNPADKTIKYDSVVDHPNNPKIYVIFFDTQAYPEYLVKYS